MVAWGRSILYAVVIIPVFEPLQQTAWHCSPHLRSGNPYPQWETQQKIPSYEFRRLPNRLTMIAVTLVNPDRTELVSQFLLEKAPIFNVLKAFLMYYCLSSSPAADTCWPHIGVACRRPNNILYFLIQDYFLILFQGVRSRGFPLKWDTVFDPFFG